MVAVVVTEAAVWVVESDFKRLSDELMSLKPLIHNGNVSRLATLTISLILFCPAIANANTDRQRAGFLGPVQSVAEESKIKGGSRTHYTRSTYDENGYEIESVIGTLKTIYKYYPQEHKREGKSYRQDGSPEGGDVYIYDANDNIMEHIFYNSDGSIRLKWSFTYDEKGKETQIILQQAGGSTSKQTMVNNYDANGNHVRELIYKADGSLDKRRIFTYDEKGRLKEKVVYNPDNSLSEKETYVYKIDSVGNWIEKTTSKWVNKSEKVLLDQTIMTTRTITYFKDGMK